LTCHQHVFTPKYRIMKNKRFYNLTGGLLAVSLLCAMGTPLALMADAAAAYVGNWALIIPNGGAGWLGVERIPDGSLTSSMLWGGGSPYGMNTTKTRGNTLVMTRIKKEKSGKQNTELYEADVQGNFIKIKRRIIDQQGKLQNEVSFNGKKIPPHGAPPDLSTLQYGEPIKLLNDKDLSGWRVMNKKAPNCWSIKDGVLSNRVTGTDGKKRHGTNIRTEKVFNDFRLTTEVRVPEHGNSGIYLRGIYEIQIAESYGKPVDCHHMGALYGRITPTVAAEKKAGEWQTLDITLCNRYITVILNGQKIIDNQPAMGCTGGAITSNEFQPGPIFLQGDHTDVDYRNMVLTPIIKN
jgi:hypothetical protein